MRLWERFANLVVTGVLHVHNGLILPRFRGHGIKVDTNRPAFGWRDIEGPIIAAATGANRPVLTTYVGEVEDYAFDANDHYSAIKFHIPHDYVPGSDLFIHTHWSHNGTNITGSLVLDHRYTYAKGHQQQAFSAEKVLTMTVGSLTITNTAQYLHRIDEVQISAASPAASQLDSDEIEPDGLIILHFNVPTIPTITGGAAKPFIHYVDLHYQSTSVGTKQKAPDFWAA